MRILHTSDWHVGRAIRGRSRAEEHRAVLAEIAGIADDEGVDAVIVAGDLFDTAAPSAESERIVYEALLALARTGATVVVLAGNHDNDRRLQAVAPLLELGRVVTRPTFARPDEGGVVTLASRDGSERALLACMPFLSQRWVVRADELLTTDAADHQLLYAERMRRIIASLTAGFTDPGTIHLVAAHAMVLGATLTGSERHAQTVFEYAMQASALPPSVQYAAFGHLHRAQQVPAPVPAWYCGSPLQLDFGETGDVKVVNVVDVSPGVPARVRSVELSAGRRLRTIAGSLAALESRAGDPDLAGAWLRVEVHQAAHVGLADEVRSRFPDAVDVVVVRPDEPAAPRERPARAGRSPQELFAEYLEHEGADDPALEALFSELLDEAVDPPVEAAS